MIVRTRLIPKGFHAFACWPLIFVLPERANDTGLIEHERVHLAEQRRMWVLPWWVAYALSRRFRLHAEVRAYRRQLEVRGISAESAARALSSLYGLGLSFESALQLLKHNASNTDNPGSAKA